MAQAVAGTRPQPGAKKRSPHQRIQDSMAVVKPARAMTIAGHVAVQGNEKEARKNGVRIVLWKKGSGSSEKYEEVYTVMVAGLTVRALRGRFTSAAAAKQSARAAGFKVVEA